MIELRETYELVCELREKWLDAGGAQRVILSVMWEELERLLGPFASVTDMFEQLEERLKAAK